MLVFSVTALLAVFEGISLLMGTNSLLEHSVI